MRAVIHLSFLKAVVEMRKRRQEKEKKNGGESKRESEHKQTWRPLTEGSKRQKKNMIF